MKQFINYLSYLIILSIGLMYFCDFVYTKIYTHSNPRNKLQFILNIKEQRYDVVFLGSSRVANHIDTKLFDSLSRKKTINLGVEGAQLNDNLLQLKLLVRENKISNLMLQIDFNYQDTGPSNLVIAEAMPFLKNDIISNHSKKYLPDSDKLSLLPFYRFAVNDPKIGFREVLLSVISKKPKVNPAIGFSPKTGSVLTKENETIQNNDVIQINDKNSILNEITEICHNNGINLILFTAPFCSRSNEKEYISDLKSRIPSLLNLSNGFEDDLFYDCGHLNVQGARIFTKKLYFASRAKLR